MSITYSQIYIHIVFAVKGRKSFIQQSWEEELYKYITGIVQNKGQKMLAINGMSDHIHILIGMKPSCNLSDLVREIKKSFFINGEAGFVEKNSVEKTIKEIKLAEFDSRPLQLPTKTETINYFIWRQQDIIRNSISSAARVHYSDKELHNVNSDEKIHLLKNKGVDWDNIDNYYKNGRIIYKQTNPESQRSQWICTSTPKFTENKEFISSLIPENT